MQLNAGLTTHFPHSIAARCERRPGFCRGSVKALTAGVLGSVQDLKNVRGLVETALGVTVVERPLVVNGHNWCALASNPPLLMRAAGDVVPREFCTQLAMAAVAGARR
jgi:hypothetical protein